MGATNAYQCDAAECGVLATREPRKQYPSTWPRVTLHLPDADGPVSGSVCSDECASAWLDEQFERSSVIVDSDQREQVQS